MAPVDGEDEPRPLSRMRRVIADRLTQSWTSTPHFTVTVAVDVTRLLALRAELKAGGTNLTVTDFVLAATAQTLAEFPDVNSRTDGISVWTRRRVHLGVAVSLPSGLVVPVIRDADRLPIGDLHERTVALATAAREGTLPVDDMTGRTFTVSNLGMFGVDEFSAIINPGEAAILAVSSAIPTAVVIEGGLAVRSVMKLTLSADHRMVDGELGARFLGAIRRRLEDAGAFRQEALNA
jgi:pyruvate dehydrogenase E2 component (dihydrolipoamide acetyltransferase)